jgi:hypothetical protein
MEASTEMITNMSVHTLLDRETKEQVGMAHVMSIDDAHWIKVQLDNSTDRYKTIDLRRYVIKIDEGRPIIFDFACTIGPKSILWHDFWDGSFRRLNNLEYLEWKANDCKTH